MKWPEKPCIVYPAQNIGDKTHSDIRLYQKLTVLKPDTVLKPWGQNNDSQGPKVNSQKIILLLIKQHMCA